MNFFGLECQFATVSYESQPSWIRSSIFTFSQNDSQKTICPPLQWKYCQLHDDLSGIRFWDANFYFGLELCNISKKWQLGDINGLLFLITEVKYYHQTAPAVKEWPAAKLMKTKKRPLEDLNKGYVYEQSRPTSSLASRCSYRDIVFDNRWRKHTIDNGWLGPFIVTVYDRQLPLC